VKIAMVTSSISRSSGGVGPVVKCLAKTLPDLSCQVSLCCRLEADTFEYLPEDRNYDLIAELSSRFCLPGGSRRLTDKLARLLPEYDILHCHSLWESCLWSSAATARRTVTPYVVTPHGMLDLWAINNSRWKKKIIGWLFTDRYLRFASCIHALNESEYKSVRAYGLNNPVAVIPNGIDLVDRSVDGKPLWKDVIPEEKKVMLFLGRIHPKKGLTNLIKAWANVKTRLWCLVIAGWSQGGHEEELKQMVVELGLEKDIIFIGPVFDEKKRVCLQNADAFVLPSFSEGLPISVLEAWSYGLPVVMTPQCNIPQGFEYNAAIRVDPKADSIGSGLSTFFALSEDQQKKIGQNGSKLVQERFTWPRVAAEMIDVYKWVLGQGDKPDCVRVD